MVAMIVSRSSLASAGRMIRLRDRGTQKVDADFSAADGHCGGNALLKLANIQRPRVGEECSPASRDKVCGMAL